MSEQEETMESLRENQEREKDPKISLDLPFEYRMMNMPNAHGGLVINASQTGLLIKSIKDMPVGTNLDTAILFPNGFELADFQSLAEIVWKDIHLEHDWEGYQYGLKFTQIKEEDSWKLQQLLNGQFQSEEFSCSC